MRTKATKFIIISFLILFVGALLSAGCSAKRLLWLEYILGIQKQIKEKYELNLNVDTGWLFISTYDYNKNTVYALDRFKTSKKLQAPAIQGSKNIYLHWQWVPSCKKKTFVLIGFLNEQESKRVINYKKHLHESDVLQRFSELHIQNNLTVVIHGDDSYTFLLPQKERIVTVLTSNFDRAKIVVKELLRKQ